MASSEKRDAIQEYSEDDYFSKGMTLPQSTTGLRSNSVFISIEIFIYIKFLSLRISFVLMRNHA
jgi:hypothetical protein